MAIDATPQRGAEVREFFGPGTGYFIEVGASHPTAGSPTWHLEQDGWRGVLVEPRPDLAAFLVTARKAQVFAVACVAPAQADKSLPLQVGGTTPAAPTAYSVIVPTRTLDSVLQEAAAPTPVNLLAVDVKRGAVDVLNGFNFERWRPRLILVEDHVGSLRTHGYLKSKGYRLIRRVGFSGWYVPNEMAARPSRQERRAIRKYYVALPFRRMRNAWRRVRRK
jgi:FkbM family methyltransferase